jgi:hypothetical protein
MLAKIAGFSKISSERVLKVRLEAKYQARCRTWYGFTDFEELLGPVTLDDSIASASFKGSHGSSLKTSQIHNWLEHWSFGE